MEASGRPAIIAVKGKGSATVHLVSNLEKKDAQDALIKTVTAASPMILACTSTRAWSVELQLAFKTRVSLSMRCIRQEYRPNHRSIAELTLRGPKMALALSWSPTTLLRFRRQKAQLLPSRKMMSLVRCRPTFMHSTHRSRRFFTTSFLEGLAHNLRTLHHWPGHAHIPEPSTLQRLKRGQPP